MEAVRMEVFVKYSTQHQM